MKNGFLIHVASAAFPHAVFTGYALVSLGLSQEIAFLNLTNGHICFFSISISCFNILYAFADRKPSLLGNLATVMCAVIDIGLRIVYFGLLLVVFKLYSLLFVLALFLANFLIVFKIVQKETSWRNVVKNFYPTLLLLPSSVFIQVHDDYVIDTRRVREGINNCLLLTKTSWTVL